VERPGQARKKTMHTFYEQHDEQGHAYYYNASTGQSQWECPEWVQYIDPHTQVDKLSNSEVGVIEMRR
jgi:spore germination cell wall hydrolase CwlJ-like protein